MKNKLKLIALGAFVMSANAAFSQTMAPPLPSQRVSLAASATVQVPQDELTLTLSTQREGANAQEVQSQLKSALDTALALAKQQAQSPWMGVSTVRFGLSPRHDRNGKLVGFEVYVSASNVLNSVNYTGYTGVITSSRAPMPTTAISMPWLL